MTGKIFLICCILGISIHVVYGVHHRYIGCYGDSIPRIMLVPVYVQNNTLDFCSSRCLTLGYTFFGLQNGQDCWCANDPTLIFMHGSSSNCNIPCTGDADQTCGGPWAMDVYSVGGFSHVGCFWDGTPRTMLDPVYVQHNSLQYCQERCSTREYKFFGVESGQDCWCANDPTLIFMYGSSYVCNVPCTGNSNQMCGGSWGMDVYTVGTQHLSDKYRYIGCFWDGAPRIMLDDVIVQHNSLEFCSTRCSSREYKYFGLQNGQDCWCANDPTVIFKYGSSSICNVPCTGDGDQICGGNMAMDVYTLGNNY